MTSDIKIIRDSGGMTQILHTFSWEAPDFQMWRGSLQQQFYWSQARWRSLHALWAQLELYFYWIVQWCAAARSRAVALFPAPASRTSYWWLRISHRGRIYTTEIDNGYRSTHLLFTEPGVKHLPTHSVCSQLLINHQKYGVHPFVGLF